MVTTLLLKKFFEIPYTGSLLIIYIDRKGAPSIEKFGFISYTNCIICLSITELKQCIDFVLDNRNEHVINDIRKNGKELVRASFYSQS